MGRCYALLGVCIEIGKAVRVITDKHNEVETKMMQSSIDEDEVRREFETLGTIAEQMTLDDYVDMGDDDSLPFD